MTDSLDEDREYLLRSLADLELEHDAGDLDDADYLALKEDYTARAAQVLRALGAGAAPAGGTTPAGSPPTRDAAGARPTGATPAGDATGATPAGDATGATPAGDATGDGAATPGRGAIAAPVPGGDVTPGDRDPDSAITPPARQLGGVSVATAPARRSPLRSVAVGAVLVILAVGAGLAVASSAGERTPGGAASGSIAATGPSAGIADDLAEARDLIEAGRTLDAIKLFDQIIEKDPEQPEALAYRGWLLRLAGRAAGNTELIDKGMEFIERAVAADPSYPDAHFFRAFVLYQDRRDPGAAVPELRTFLALDPPEGMVAVVQDLLKRALAESEGPTTPPAQPGPAPSPPAR